MEHLSGEGRKVPKLKLYIIMRYSQSAIHGLNRLVVRHTNLFTIEENGDNNAETLISRQTI